MHKQRSLLAAQEYELLSAIADTGSISKAAKRVGVSYKTAWQRVTRLNNLSASPLVIPSTGGSKGGGSLLSTQGKTLLQDMAALLSSQNELVPGSVEEPDAAPASLLLSSGMRSSARNQFLGRVSEITRGSVNTTITLSIQSGIEIVAVITEHSRELLGLQVGDMAVALIKASSVLLSVDTDIVTSARNKLVGHIERLDRDEVNADITIALAEGKHLSATVTERSAALMALHEGQPICALFKASSVIIMLS